MKIEIDYISSESSISNSTYCNETEINSSALLWARARLSITCEHQLINDEKNADFNELDSWRRAGEKEFLT